MKFIKLTRIDNGGKIRVNMDFAEGYGPSPINGQSRTVIWFQGVTELHVSETPEQIDEMVMP